MNTKKVVILAAALAPFCASAQEAPESAPAPAETSAPDASEQPSAATVASLEERIAALEKKLAEQEQQLQQNAAETPASSAPATSDDKKITIEIPALKDDEDIKVELHGIAQIQYVYSTCGGDGHAGDRNGFAVRRVTLGADVDVGNGWTGKIVYEFDSGNNGGWIDDGYVESALISKKIDDFNGTLSVGHKKTHFMHEEYTSASKLSCIERSINSNFVSGNSYVRGLAGHHIGVFWEGKLGKTFDYGASLTNAVARDYDKKSNDLAITGNVGWKLELDDDAQIYFGLNATVNFGDDGDPETFGSSSDTILTNAGTVYGIEPYIEFKNGGFSLLADAYYINGDDDSEINRFYGLNLTAKYRFPCGFEPAVRFTYLNTDSGVVKTSIQNRIDTSEGHDNATTYYIGANYYFGKYVKLASGYEYGHCFGGGSGQVDYGAFRSMLQISF